MFAQLVIVLEKLGVRCSKCSLWLTQRVDIEEKLDWGTNVGGIFFTDPHYVKITTCRCAQCDHLMFRMHELSDKKVEV